MNHTFSINESLKYGWDTFKKNWKFLVPYFFIIALFEVVISYFGDTNVSPLGEGGVYIISLLGGVVGIFISAGIIKNSLKIFHGETVSIKKDFFPTRSDAWNYFSSNLAFVLVAILCFIPAFILGFVVFRKDIGFASILAFIIGFILLFFVSIIFAFWSQISIDHNKKWFASLKHSQRITKEHRSKILVFALVIGLINILGVICLGIGLFVSIPVSMLAWIYVYKKLDGQNDVHTDIVEQPVEIATSVPENTEKE